MKKIISHFKDCDLLRDAFKYLITNNKGYRNPYHNNRHIIGVFITSMEIANTYDSLTEKDILELGLAALFHDFDHSGGLYKNDADNITLAINGLNSFLMGNKSMVKSYDIDVFKVEELIRITKYPNKTKPSNIKEEIICDSDLLQSYNGDWFLNIIIGLLNTELKLTMQASFRNQIKFIKNVKYYTDHAKFIHNKKQDELLNEIRFFAKLFK